MRFVKLTSPIIGTPTDKLSEINYRLMLICVTCMLFIGAGASIKYLFWDQLFADAVAVLFGLVAILPCSMVPSLWSMRQSIKQSLL